MALELTDIVEKRYPFNDLAAINNVEIIIRDDGAVTWINLDGICICRISCDGKIPISVKDNRGI